MRGENSSPFLMIPGLHPRATISEVVTLSSLHQAETPIERDFWILEHLGAETLRAVFRLRQKRILDSGR